VEFSIQAVTEGPTTTLRVAGEVDLATADELSQAAVTALRGGAEALVIDLAAVTFLDSTGLAVLVGVTNQASASGVALTIRDAVPRVRNVIRITGLGDFLPLAPPD
jgi:anti-sigma B factor antagonist